MNLILGLAGASSKRNGSVNLSLDRLIRMSAPKSFTAREVAKVRRDCEILLERLKDDPKGFQSLVKVANSGDMSAARKLAKKMKLTELDFEKEGGGCFFLLFVLFILVLIYVDRKNIAWI